MSEQSQERSARIGFIDVLRGVALIAMASYHFTWDLEFFQYVDPGTATTGAMKWYARGIASTFLILAGIALVLAHGEATRWPAFGKRFAKVAGAALLVSVGTYFAMGRGFIFFGILHQIALGSLIGLAFVRLPVALTLAVAAAMIGAPHFLRNELFDTPALWWVGLSSVDPFSNDYVAVLPWTGMILIGIAVARLGLASGVFDGLSNAQPHSKPIGRVLSFAGRHSLAFYLVHQPVLLAGVYLFSLVAPAAPVDPALGYQNACVQNCMISRDRLFCDAFCPCVKIRLESVDKFDALISGKLDPQTDPDVVGSAQACSVEAETNGQ